MTNNLELVLLKNIIHPIEGGSQMLVEEVILRMHKSNHCPVIPTHTVSMTEHLNEVIYSRNLDN